jgi:hypothetical protein
VRRGDATATVDVLDVDDDRSIPDVAGDSIMPRSTDTYEDGDGNVWAFDPPYDDEEVPPDDDD